MVFIEMDRNEKLLDNIRALVKDVEHVKQVSSWKVTLPYFDEAMDLLHEGLEKHVLLDPDLLFHSIEYKEKIAPHSRSRKIRTRAGRSNG